MILSQPCCLSYSKVKLSSVSQLPSREFHPISPSLPAGCWTSFFEGEGERGKGPRSLGFRLLQQVELSRGLRVRGVRALEGPGERGAATWHSVCMSPFSLQLLSPLLLWRASERDLSFPVKQSRGHGWVGLLPGLGLAAASAAVGSVRPPSPLP